jgi:hypothetical protein
VSIFDDIARSTYSWYGWTSAGVLTVGRLNLASLASATATATITQADIIDGTELAFENLPLPWGKVTVDSDPNTTVQTDSFAGTATAANRAIWGRPYQVRVTTTDPAGTDYLGNWWDYHKSAIDSAPISMAIGTPLLSGVFAGSPAQEVCDAVTALFKPWTRVYRETVGLEWYDLTPGDIVELVHPRYGLEDGKNVAVVSVAPNFSEGTCDLIYVAPERSPTTPPRATHELRAHRPGQLLRQRPLDDLHLAGRGQRLPGDEPAVERVERHAGSRRTWPTRSTATSTAARGRSRTSRCGRRRPTASSARRSTSRCGRTRDDHLGARPGLRLLHAQRRRVGHVPLGHPELGRGQRRPHGAPGAAGEVVHAGGGVRLPHHVPPHRGARDALLRREPHLARRLRRRGNERERRLDGGIPDRLAASAQSDQRDAAPQAGRRGGAR